MNFLNILSSFKNQKIIFRLLKLFRAGLRDPLFWLLFSDYILTLFVIKSGAGIEANPLVAWLGNGPAFLIELFIYFAIVPKKNFGLIRFFLIARYSFICIRHIFILYITFHGL